MNAPSGPTLSPASLASLREAASVLGFDIPPSHRRFGSLVTAVKRRLLPGLGTVQRELLRHQLRFNEGLVDCLALLPAGAELRADLRALANPREGLLEAQHTWNLAALSLLEDVCAAWPLPPREAVERLAALERASDVLPSGVGPLPWRAVLPLWREVLRGQMVFNHVCVQSLRRMLGLARPELDMPSPEAYAAWCELREAGDLQAAAKDLAGLTRRPLISILTPAYRTPPDILAACIESVLAQSYPHWELCLVDDGSPDDSVVRTAARYTGRDPRIRFQRLERNGGIARATNAALQLATGDFIGFLDHDDVLRPHALAEVALRLEAEPDTDVLYSDEDKLDGEGRRFAPYLKPDFSPDLLRALNYVCHFLVVRAPLLRELGGIREGFDGAQDHDLVLRLMERTQRFAHIPRILYHWRAMAGSTSVDASAKPAASEAGRRAVEEHLRRQGEEGSVETVAPGVYRVRRPVRTDTRVSIIVRATGATQPEDTWVQSLLSRTDWPHVEVLLAGAADEQQGPVRRVAVEPGLGRAAVANRLAARATGEVLLFLDAGLEPGDTGWLRELVSEGLRSDVGMVGARLVEADGTLRHAGLVLGVGDGVAACFAGQPDAVLTAFGGSHWPRNLLAVSGACLLVRRELFTRLGGFDEGYTASGEDVALCLGAIDAGLRVLYTPHARLVASRAGNPMSLSPTDQERLAHRARRYVERGDPFYNPNLSRHAASGALVGTGGKVSRSKP